MYVYIGIGHHPSEIARIGRENYKRKKYMFMTL